MHGCAASFTMNSGPRAYLRVQNADRLATAHRTSTGRSAQCQRLALNAATLRLYRKQINMSSRAEAFNVPTRTPGRFLPLSIHVELVATVAALELIREVSHGCYALLCMHTTALRPCKSAQIGVVIRHRASSDCLHQSRPSACFVAKEMYRGSERTHQHK